MALRMTPKSFTRVSTRIMQLGDPGSGAGKSGGGGGSIRESGGAFGKLEAAREAEYFHKLQKRQLEELKAHVHEELEHTQQQLDKNTETLNRHKQRLAELDALAKKAEKK